MKGKNVYAQLVKDSSDWATVMLTLQEVTAQTTTAVASVLSHLYDVSNQVLKNILNGKWKDPAGEKKYEGTNDPGMSDSDKNSSDEINETNNVYGFANSEYDTQKQKEQSIVQSLNTMTSQLAENQKQIMQFAGTMAQMSSFVSQMMRGM